MWKAHMRAQVKKGLRALWSCDAFIGRVWGPFYRSLKGICIKYFLSKLFLIKLSIKWYQI